MKRFLLIILTIWYTSGAYAQQEAMASQYLFNGLYVNPAYAGSHDWSTGSVIVRKQWVGYDGAPFTQFLSYEMPFKSANMGLGFTGTNDKIGVTNKTDLFANYSYHLKFRTFKLAMGIRAGGSLYSAKLSDLVIWDEPDPVFDEDIKSTFVANFGAGLYLYSDNYYLGFSVPNLLSFDPDRALSIDISKDIHLVQHLYFNAGLILNKDGAVQYYPSVLLKYTKNAPLEGDFNFMTLIGRTIWLGAGYRTGDSFIGFFGYQINRNLRLGYAYDYAVNPLGDHTSGSHEFSLGFDIGKESQKMKSPRFF